MRKSLLLYLFVFTALLAIFMYVTGQRMLSAKDEKIEELETEIASNVDINEISSEIPEPDSFSLLTNEEAITALEKRGFEASEVVAKIEEQLISGNKVDADHELVPYEGMQGFFRINKVKLLNHKWAIASFTDGTYWGDLFLSFDIDDGGEVTITTEKAVLYSPN